MNGTGRSVKVAVLGGGMAALTTAFELTRPEMQGAYEVTVYQMGWRLGGKGASGRNAKIAQRIEEHGLHIWMGFYENAFRVMRAAYEELDRTSGPIQTWTDAFKQHSYVVLEEKLATGWYPWTFDFPTNGELPGDGREPPLLWEMVTQTIRWMFKRWTQSPFLARADLFAARIPGWVGRILDDVGGAFAGLDPDVLHAPSVHLGRAEALADSLVGRAFEHGAGEHNALVWLIREFMRLVWLVLKDDVDTSQEAHELWVAINLGGSAVAGILADGILFKGWDSIDDRDLRTWLAEHGANEATLDSAPLRGVYDLVFGYVGGDVKKGRFAAGTAMRGIFRMLLTYRGALMWKMQAGMGDIVFSPFYEVLARRGVKFEFFHRVKNLALSPDKNLVQRIELEQQVALKSGPYEPLVMVDGVPSWPSAPRYDQIVDGAELEASGINLESAWAKPWKGTTPKTLVLGTDYDQVVLGISVGGLPYCCPELVAASTPFADMVANIATVQTCAFQLWLAPDLAGLGWQVPPGIGERPVLGSFWEPLDTWADMSQLLPRETWPKTSPVGSDPKNVAYFCGPWEEVSPIPPFTDHGYPAREVAKLDVMAKGFLESQIQTLWPGMIDAGGFRWDQLVSLTGGTGPARFATQYRRVNVDPTERYVLSVPGSTKFRLKARGAGFQNVVLAGDWTSNGFNAGCIEAAAMSGLHAARALLGPRRGLVPIYGIREMRVANDGEGEPGAF